MHSALYFGHIRHRRFRPVENRFRYPIFFMFLDLEELDTVFSLHPRWSSEGTNLAVFRRRDHFGDPRHSLASAVRSLVERKTGTRPGGPIRLLTHLRYFGYCFNPVSFYYCYDPSGTEPEAIVAEITNTPWLERHCYVFGRQDNLHADPRWRRYRFAKAFHVSPFMEMDLACDWRFRIPGAQLNIHMINLQRGVRLFDATLSLEREAITRESLSRALFRYPFMTARVTARIYRQALRLWWRNVPFFPHPSKRMALQ